MWGGQFYIEIEANGLKIEQRIAWISFGKSGMDFRTSLSRGAQNRNRCTQTQSKSSSYVWLLANLAGACPPTLVVFLLLTLDEAVASRAVFVVVSGSGGRAGGNVFEAN